MQAASLLDGFSFDLFPPFENGLAAPEIDVSRRQVVQALVVSTVVLVADELFDALFELSWQDALCVCEVDGELTRRQVRLLPARPGADRHARDSKPPRGSSIARVSSTRADRARPRPAPARHPWGCWIFAGRAPRSRSDNLIVSMTEQRAALPYQGSAGPRARGGEDPG